MSKTSQKKDSPSITEQMTALSELVEQLEDPEIELEAALVLYEKGVKAAFRRPSNRLNNVSRRSRRMGPYWRRTVRRQSPEPDGTVCLARLSRPAAWRGARLPAERPGSNFEAPHCPLRRVNCRQAARLR